VLQFPNIATGTLTETSRTVVGDLVPALDALPGKLKAAIETIVAEASIKQALTLTVSDNPFDAVYISRLRADELETEDLNRLQRFADIVDASGSIVFNDGWDD
jgi:hypothetical protein